MLSCRAFRAVWTRPIVYLTATVVSYMKGEAFIDHCLCWSYGWIWKSSTIRPTMKQSVWVENAKNWYVICRSHLTKNHLHSLRLHNLMCPRNEWLQAVGVGSNMNVRTENTIHWGAGCHGLDRFFKRCIPASWIVPHCLLPVRMINCAPWEASHIPLLLKG